MGWELLINFRWKNSRKRIGNVTVISSGPWNGDLFEESLSFRHCKRGWTLLHLPRWFYRKIYAIYWEIPTVLTIALILRMKIFRKSNERLFNAVTHDRRLEMVSKRLKTICGWKDLESLWKMFFWLWSIANRIVWNVWCMCF